MLVVLLFFTKLFPSTQITIVVIAYSTMNTKLFVLFHIMVKTYLYWNSSIIGLK